jgi:hypothetical protein
MSKRAASPASRLAARNSRKALGPNEAQLLFEARAEKHRQGVRDRDKKKADAGAETGRQTFGSGQATARMTQAAATAALVAGLALLAAHLVDVPGLVRWAVDGAATKYLDHVYGTSTKRLRRLLTLTPSRSSKRIPMLTLTPPLRSVS